MNKEEQKRLVDIAMQNPKLLGFIFHFHLTWHKLNEEEREKLLDDLAHCCDDIPELAFKLAEFRKGRH